MDYTLIANTGIQITTFPLCIDFQEKFKMWFHEWFDTQAGEWKLDLVQEVNFETGIAFYLKKELREKGYLSAGNIAAEYEYTDLKDDGVNPLNGTKGEIFKLTFNDKSNVLSAFENVWLPAPYFFKRTEKKFKFGPLNWARFKIIPVSENNGKKIYNVLLAFDTRAKYKTDEYNEYPVFPDQYEKKMTFELCTNEAFLMDYCSPSNRWGYIDEYLMKLVHPDIQRVSQLKGSKY